MVWAEGGAVTERARESSQVRPSLRVGVGPGRPAGEPAGEPAFILVFNVTSDLSTQRPAVTHHLGAC